MSPSEIRELRQPHLRRCADLLCLSAFAFTILALLAFHAGWLAWGLVGWACLVVFVFALCAAASRGDDIAHEAIRAHTQEQEAREACRPAATVVIQRAAQPTSLLERRLAALDFVRDRVADEDRLVLTPRHMFETEDGVRTGWPVGVEPCRACLVGWACTAEDKFGFEDDSVQLAVEKACELLMIRPDEDDGHPVTRATREGPATLKAVVLLAREVVAEETPA